MEIDLQCADVSSRPFRAQVCIVGAGIAGLVLAQRLSKNGISVALLEAGGLKIEEHAQREFESTMLKGQPHRGTVEGRFRVFGGSSLRWGGQLLPMPSPSAWPVSADELARYTAEAERLLGVDDLPYAGESFFARIRQHVPALVGGLKGVDVDLSKWVPFSQRNLAETLGRSLRADPNVIVYLNAQATELLPNATGEQIQSLTARNTAGESFRFEADQFVLAAGTVETVRLLLLSKSAVREGLGNAYGQVGQNFHDHLTLPVATATGKARESLLRGLRPWIVRGTAHSIKLQADGELCKRLGLNPVLAHVTIEEPEESGTALVRQFLLRKQLGGPRTGSLTAVLRTVLEAAHLVWDAKLHGRRFVSKTARVQLTLNAAQDAPTLSRITLSEQTDAKGIPQAQVEWHITQNEMATLCKFATHMKEQFGALDGMHWCTDLDAATVPKSMDDARHAMGGACMGEDPRSSVVGADLSVHGIANLSIASAAVFPDGSPQLPTLPLLALTLRLAERLATQLQL